MFFNVLEQLLIFGKHFLIYGWAITKCKGMIILTETESWVQNPLLVGNYPQNKKQVLLSNAPSTLLTSELWS